MQHEINLTQENSVGLICEQCARAGQESKHMKLAIRVDTGLLVYVCALHETIAGTLELTASALIQAQMMHAQAQAKRPDIVVPKIVKPTGL